MADTLPPSSFAGGVSTKVHLIDFLQLFGGKEMHDDGVQICTYNEPFGKLHTCFFSDDTLSRYIIQFL